MSINCIKILLFSIVSILFFTGFTPVQKANDPIILRDEKFSFTPTGFYISEVTDERTGRRNVATVLYKDEEHGYAARSADLKGGAAPAIKSFLDHNLSKNTALRPVVFSIRQLKLTETSPSPGKISGQLTVEISFGLQEDYGVLKLISYSGGMHYTRSDVQTDIPESIIRRGILMS